MGLHIISDGPGGASATLLLAHGAGAPMDSPAMTAIARALAAEGLRVARFEFPYMAARRHGARRPPPRAETLVESYREAVAALAIEGPLVIGGKSMGGRVAALVADELHVTGGAAGLLCIGYPFHPPANPRKLRTAHLETLAMPTLIVQGTRDPFGTRAEVEGYLISPSIEILWLGDGDHDLKPRKSVSGFTIADHLATMAGAVAGWVARITA
jgi:predicted alpha/beta-hydrolase family hydrolase